MTQQLQSGIHWRGVVDPRRSARAISEHITNNNLMKTIEQQFSTQQFSQMRKMLRSCVFSLLACLAVVQVQGQTTLTANFDSFANNFSANVLTDGGIMFSNLDCRALGGDVFVIQATTASLPGFSHPNYLTFDDNVSSPDGGAYGFFRFGSADIGFGSAGSAASVGILGNTSPSLNTLTLQALLGGSVISTDTMSFSGSPGVIYRTLNVSGSFDRLRLVAGGADNSGTVFMGIDNVMIAVVPEPGSGLLLCCGIAVFRCAYLRIRRE
jgi:hypothetical protein